MFSLSILLFDNRQPQRARSGSWQSISYYIGNKVLAAKMLSYADHGTSDTKAGDSVCLAAHPVVVVLPNTP